MLVRAGFADPQPVEAEQHGERGVVMVDALGGEQERAERGSVHPRGLGGVHRRAAHVLGGVRRDAPVDVREPVEAAHRREPAINRGRGEASFFEVDPEQLDVGPGGCQHVEPDVVGPLEERAQVVAVGLAGAAAVAGQERGDSDVGLVGGVPTDGGEQGRVVAGGLHERPPGRVASNPHPPAILRHPSAGGADGGCCLHARDRDLVPGRELGDHDRDRDPSTLSAGAGQRHRGEERVAPEVIGAPPRDLLQKVRLETASDRGAAQHRVLELAVLLADELVLGEVPLTKPRVADRAGARGRGVSHDLRCEAHEDLARERVVPGMQPGHRIDQLAHVLAGSETHEQKPDRLEPVLLRCLRRHHETNLRQRLHRLHCLSPLPLKVPHRVRECRR